MQKKRELNLKFQINFQDNWNFSPILLILEISRSKNVENGSCKLALEFQNNSNFTSALSELKFSRPKIVQNGNRKIKILRKSKFYLLSFLLLQIHQSKKEITLTYPLQSLRKLQQSWNFNSRLLKLRNVKPKVVGNEQREVNLKFQINILRFQANGNFSLILLKLEISRSKTIENGSCKLAL